MKELAMSGSKKQLWPGTQLDCFRKGKQETAIRSHNSTPQHISKRVKAQRSDVSFIVVNY